MVIFETEKMRNMVSRLIVPQLHLLRENSRRKGW